MFSTKADTLGRLEGRLEHARVLPQHSFSVGDWLADRGVILAALAERNWLDTRLIVRSSALDEDGDGNSNAGRFNTIADVTGKADVANAIDQVAASYGSAGSSSNQILVQPFLGEVASSGVVFTRNPNSGGYYFTFEVDDTSGRTDTVTSGSSLPFRTVVCALSAVERLEPPLDGVATAALEIEKLLDKDSLDIEFAIDFDGNIVIFQARPLHLQANPTLDRIEQAQALNLVESKVKEVSKPHPYLFGERTIFGVMPDWNPAEIVGIKPRPLALSLYRDLVTDAVWAYQRDNYGYLNLRSFPLLISLLGAPYIDARISFNSFLPKGLSDSLCSRLVGYYLDRFEHAPDSHDKVEFEILFSCFTFDIRERLSGLSQHGFSESDLDQLSHALQQLTNRAIRDGNGIFHADMARVGRLNRRRNTIIQSELGETAKIYWLLEDCKRYGTLPFAGAARAGFIAMQLLDSLVNVGVFSEDDRFRFLASMNTVARRMRSEQGNLSREDFLARYGHLRPGTYDILSPRYDEEPDLYFDWSVQPPRTEAPSPFYLTSRQEVNCEKLLSENRIDLTPNGLIDFIGSAIEGRESAKFVFSHSLSDALQILTQLGERLGFTRDDLSYCNIGVLQQQYASAGDLTPALGKSSARGRQDHATTEQLVLPTVIASSGDVKLFEQFDQRPNYVTTNRIVGPISDLANPSGDLEGKILLLTNADPGCDWIFSRRIGGFITQYGGMNSHMAIRANELGVPAALGVGEKRFERYVGAKTIELDCANQTIRLLR
jgi:glutamine kinase